MKHWWYRQQAKWRLWRALGSMINRRVAVENVLFSVASGKRPMLSREECRELANRLGSAA